MRSVSLIMAMVTPLLMVALTACGSSESGDDVATGGGKAPGTSSPTPKSGDDSGIRFTQCMREHGVNLPDPEPGKQAPLVDGPEGSREHQALEACKPLLPNAGEDTKISPEDLEKVRQYARCMRDNGVDMADPDPDGGIKGATGGDRAKMDAADKVCQSKLPGQLK